MKLSLQARRLKFNLIGIRHRQEVDDAVLLVHNLLVLLDCKQNMCRPAAVGNENRPALGRLFCPTGVLVEFPAGYRRNGQVKPAKYSNVSTL